jgi:lysophospholipase L1-like esterase
MELRKVIVNRFYIWMAMLALLLGSLAPGSALALGEKVNYVALGDSLAAGQTPDKKWDKGFSGIIKESLEKQNALANYSNKFAVSGYTTQNVLDDIVNNKEVEGVKIQDVVKAANIITITAGANDLLREVNIDKTKGTVVVDPQKAVAVATQVKTNLTSIVKKIKELNPTAKVYISGYYNAFPYLAVDQQALLSQVLTAFNGIIQQTALENGAVFVSLHGIFDKDVKRYLPNPLDIHPSLEGYQLIANQFLTAFSTSKPSFEDVPADFWAYKEITLLADSKVLAGTSAALFDPEKSITRAEAATALFKVIPLDKKLPNNPGFTDVPQTHAAYIAIAKLTEVGIFAKATKFNPDAPLTRAQMAKILALSFQIPPTQTIYFWDVPKNHWATNYINAIAGAKISVGYPNHTFQPDTATNRAQFAVFLVKAANTLTTK